MEMMVFVLVLCIIFAAWVQRVLYRMYWNKNLESNICFDNRAVTEHEIVKMYIQIRNKKRLPLPVLSVLFRLPNALAEMDMEQKKPCDSWEREELFSLFSYEEITRTLTFYCQQRGVYKLSEVRLKNKSLLLDAVCEQKVPVDCQLTVYPSCVDMRQFALRFQKLLGAVLANDFQFEDVFLVRGVRPYQPFDSWKNINWNATAKLGGYMVNNYEYTTSRRAAVFLNLMPDGKLQHREVMEESIRLAKTWCVNLEKVGVQCSVYTNAVEEDSGECIFVDKQHLEKKYRTALDEALARIVLEKVSGEPFCDLWREQIEKCSKEYYLVFISAYQHEDFQKGLSALGGQAANFAWVLPLTGSGVYRVRKELEKHVVVWDVYWRRERNDKILSV